MVYRIKFNNERIGEVRVDPEKMLEEANHSSGGCGDGKLYYSVVLELILSWQIMMFQRK